MTIQITPPPNTSDQNSPVWKDWFSRLYVIIKNLGVGDVVGPASATDGHVAVFDGTTGKLLKDNSPLVTASGLTMSTEKLLGRTTASTGAVEEIAVDGSLDLSTGVLSVVGAGTYGGSTQCIPVACSDETTALTTGLKATFRMPYAMTLSSVRGSLTTAATGATLFAFDVKEDGVSIFSTKPTIDASEKTTTTATTPAVLSLLGTVLADDSEITIHIDAVGNTIAGAGFKTYLIGTVGGSSPPVVLGSLAAWYQYNTGITESGGLVSQWADQSGNARHLVQATGTNKPSKEADGSLLFNGTDNYMVASSWSQTQPVSVYVLCKVITWPGGNDYLWDGTTSQSMSVFHDGTAGGTSFYAFANGVQSAARTLALDTYGVFTIVFNGASSVFQIDAGSEATGNFGTLASGGFTLGSIANQATFGNIQVKEVLIYNAAHDATARAAVQAYLATV